MISLAKFKSFTIEQGKRILKLTQFGAKTAKESYPFGFDSVPLSDWTAIYAETSNKDESVIIGYINRKQIAAMGESRMYSIGGDGEVKAFVWNKSNGDLWLNGSDYTATRYAPLNTALQDEKNLINIELAKISTAISALGGSYIPANIIINISQSESSTIKIK